jgi:hypothetical protein
MKATYKPNHQPKLISMPSQIIHTPTNQRVAIIDVAQSGSSIDTVIRAAMRMDPDEVELIGGSEAQQAQFVSRGFLVHMHPSATDLQTLATRLSNL